MLEPPERNAKISSFNANQCSKTDWPRAVANLNPSSSLTRDIWCGLLQARMAALCTKDTIFPTFSCRNLAAKQGVIASAALHLPLITCKFFRLKL